MKQYNFHPNLKKLLKFNNDIPLCPNCQTPMQDRNDIYLSCEECTKEVFFQKSKDIFITLFYSMIIKKKKFHITIDFDKNSTSIYNYYDDITVPHTNFPFFNGLKMRDKIKLLLTFQ
jgi:hypothetical protein